MTLPPFTTAPLASPSGLTTARARRHRRGPPIALAFLAPLAFPAVLLGADPAVPASAPARGLPGIPHASPGPQTVRPPDGRRPFDLLAHPDLRWRGAWSREPAALGGAAGAGAGPLAGGLEAAAVSFVPSGLPEELLSSMLAEARRFRSAHLFDGSGRLDPADSVAEELRAREVQRIMTRAFNRTLDRQVDTLARTSDGLRSAIDWLQDLGSIRRRDRAAGAASSGMARPATAWTADGFHTSVGLRLSAHPELTMSAGIGSLRGRLELPLTGEPLRLSLEHPLGPRGRVALSSGLARDGSDWAAAGLSFSF